MSGSGEHSERLREYFDAHAEDWAGSYRQVRTANDVVLAERLALALDLTEDLPTDARVLDAGCGTGPLTVELARRGRSVLAIDVAPRMVELCRRSLREAGLGEERVELRCGEIAAIERSEARFDAVYALGFLQYQEDELEALRRLRALLRPGGRLVVSGPIGRRLGNLFGLWDSVAQLRRRLAGGRDRPATELDRLLAVSMHTYSLGRLRQLLGAAGLATLETRPHGFVNYALIGPALGTRGELALHRFFTRLSRVLPIGRFANDVVALAQRPEAAAGDA